jgi:hypothetical protein
LSICGILSHFPDPRTYPAVSVISVAPAGLSAGHEHSSFSAGDTCPGVWTVPRPALSASDDRVRVCGFPSRYPWPSQPGLPGSSTLGRPATRPLRFDFEVDDTTSGAALRRSLTLAAYVEALGRRLEIIAGFGDERFAFAEPGSETG